MLRLVPVRSGSSWAGKVAALYRAAFPANERMSLTSLLTDRSGGAEVLAAVEEDRFLGLSVQLSWQDITHILYFAVEEGLRGQGWGSRILRAVGERYAGQRLLADVEEPYPGAANRRQRQRRIAFYRRGGYSLSSVRYAWAGERYLILVAGGEISEEEFWAFWESFYR